MGVISSHVMSRIEATDADIFYIPRAAAKWWNAQRSDTRTIIAIFCGWYWSHRGQEAGPFKTRSAAQRDFFYRQVTRQRPPLMDADDLKQSERETSHARIRDGGVYAQARA